MMEFIKSLDPNSLIVPGVILIWGYAMLLINRLVIQPVKTRRRIRKEEKARMQLRATQRLKQIQTAEGDRTDVWSRTRSHDTISRALDPVLQKKFNKMGMFD